MQNLGSDRITNAGRASHANSLPNRCKRVRCECDPVSINPRGDFSRELCAVSLFTSTKDAEEQYTYQPRCLFRYTNLAHSARYTRPII
jgi:hypothetical protein